MIRSYRPSTKNRNGRYIVLSLSQFTQNISRRAIQHKPHRTFLRIFGQTNNRSAETPFVQKWLRHQQRAPVRRHHPPAYMNRFDVHTDTIKSLSNIKIQSRSSKQIVKFHRQKNALAIISFHMVSNCYDSKQAK